MCEKTNEELLKEIKELESENQAYKDALVELAEHLENEEVNELENIENVLFSERMIYIHDEISQQTLTEISPLIDYFNIKDRDIPVGERKTIYIKIGTYGGEAYEAVGIIDAIKNSVTPIHVHVEGKAMSAGIYIWANAHTRSMGEGAILMYHQLQLRGIGGTLEELQNSIREFKRLQKTLNKAIIKNLNVPKEKLKEINKQSKDWFIDYKKAKKYKMF